MKRTLRKDILVPLTGFLLICLVAIILEARYKVIQRAYDNIVLDNRNHYLPCTGLPTESEVETVVAQHQNVIRQIQQLALGAVNVEIDTSICPGKADLLISYGTHEQRVAIEKIIDGDTFFGIPYRLQNH